MTKKLLAGIALLLVITGSIAALHLSQQDRIGCMMIVHNEQQIPVSFEELDRVSFSGELIDGKGDTSTHSYIGILLRDLLEEKGIDPAQISGVTVTSADNYSADFTPEEILQDNKVYAAVTADGAAIAGIDPGTDGVQIITFGDPNSRRCVRFAQKITIH